MTHADDGTTAPTPGGRLRALLAEGELIVAPGVFDGLSAHLARRTGFRAAYLTGAGVAASGFGLPDIGLVTGSETAERGPLRARRRAEPSYATAVRSPGAAGLAASARSVISGRQHPTDAGQSLRVVELLGVGQFGVERVDVDGDQLDLLLAAVGSITWDCRPTAIRGCACRIPSNSHNKPKPIRPRSSWSGTACGSAASASAARCATRRSGPATRPETGPEHLSGPGRSSY